MRASVRGMQALLVIDPLWVRLCCERGADLGYYRAQLLQRADGRVEGEPDSGRDRRVRWHCPVVVPDDLGGYRTEAAVTGVSPADGKTESRVGQDGVRDGWERQTG